MLRRIIMPARTAGGRGRMWKTVLNLDFDARDFSELFCVTDEIPAKQHNTTYPVPFDRIDVRFLIRAHGTKLLQ